MERRPTLRWTVWACWVGVITLGWRVTGIRHELRHAVQLESTPENLADLLLTGPVVPPSNALLYPLDFQDTWQASKESQIFLNIGVPVNGAKDYIKKLQAVSDLHSSLRDAKHAQRLLRRDLDYEEKQAAFLMRRLVQREALAHRIVDI